MKPLPDSALYALAELYEAFWQKPWKTEPQFDAMERAAGVLSEHQTFRTLQKEFEQWAALNKKQGEHPNERYSPRDRLKKEKQRLEGHRRSRKDH